MRYCYDLPHPGLWRAPQVGTVGLRNSTSLSPVREKGDKVFGERSARLLTDSFVTDALDSNDYFPDDDFFPDVDNLLDDMAGKDTDPKSSAFAAAVPYVFFLFLLEAVLQFLVLVFALDMLDSISYVQPAILSALDMFSYGSYMNMLFTFSL